MATVATDSMAVVSSRSGVWERFVRIWTYRELLVGMVRKELKVKYKNSALGFVWSMLNPALYLVVFYVVFQIVLGSGIPKFPIFLLSGLLVWNLFSTALSSACGSIVGNASIIKKVSFPREILPLASVGASLVHFFLQALVLVAALIIFQWDVALRDLPLLAFALLVLLLLTASLAVFLSAVNVYLRDTQHLLELALLAWFWGTPIVYQFRLVSDRIAENGWPEWLPFLNPVTPIVLTFQHVLYNTTSSGGINILPVESSMWYLAHLLVVGVISSFFLIGAMMLFGRLEGNFAEEL